MNVYFLNIRSVRKIFDNGCRCFAVLDFLFWEINTRKGNKVFLPPVLAGKLGKRCVRKQVNSTFKKVYLVAVAVCSPKRIVLVTAGTIA